MLPHPVSVLEVVLVCFLILAFFPEHTWKQATATSRTRSVYGLALPKLNKMTLSDVLVAGMRGTTGSKHGLARLAKLNETEASSIIYRALDTAHGFARTKMGSGKGGGKVNGAWIEGYSNPTEGGSLRAMVRGLSGVDNRTLQVCEIGFNGGHSAANYLVMNLFGLRVRYLGFDLGEHPYAHTARRFLLSLFGDRIDVVWGDSERTLRDYHAANPHFVCDVAMVDGLHTYAAALADTLNFLPLTRSGSIVAIDDMTHPQLGQAWRDAHTACPQSLRRQGCMGNHWCRSQRTTGVKLKA